MLLADSFTETNPATLTVGTPLQTSFTNREEDWFSIVLTAGVTYQFTVAGASGGGGTLTDTVSLYLYGHAPRSNAIAASSWGATGVLASLPFTPSVSGTYRLSANAWASGSYTIAANVAAPDDIGSSTTSFAVLPIGGSVAASIGLPSDRDWFAVTVEAGQLYHFTIEDRASTSRTLYMNLYDSTGKEVSWAGIYSYGTPEMRTGAPLVSGTYYVEVLGVQGVGDYTVRAVALADDYTLLPGGVGQIADGMTVHGAIEERNDVDWIAFNAVAGHAYVFDVVESDILWFNAQIRDGSTYYTRQVSKYDPFVPTKSGVYYVQLSGARAGSYSVSMREPADDYPNSDLSTVRLGDNQQLQGRIDYMADADLFKMTVVQGTVYQLDLRAAGTEQISFALRSDPLLTVETVQQTSAVGAVSNTFRARASGEIQVVLSGYELASYTLTSRVVSVDDHPDYGPGVTALAPGQAILGALQTKGDVDAFRIGVEAGKSYVVQVSGALGATLRVSQYSGESSPFTTATTKFYATTTGDKLVYVAAGGQIGGFTISAIATPNDDFRATELSNARYDGGAGFDTITYVYGIASAYKIIRSGADFKISSAYADGGKYDTFSGVDRIYFTAGQRQAHALDVDGAGIGGAAYRLYQAAFDRTPDQAGVGFWISAMDKGMSLREVAAGFVASSEFKSLYGASSTNLEFISRLYANVLNRPGEAAGIDYWVKALDAGYARVDALVNFSEGFENTAAVAQVIGNGFGYIPYG